MNRFSKRKQVIPSEQQDQYDDIRPFPLYAILFCGLIIVLAGLYLVLTNDFAKGVSSTGRFGKGRAHSIVLSGPVVILIGVGMCIYPAYELLKRKLKKR